MEKIALALYSLNPSRIESVNEILESESKYTKIPSPPRRIEIFARRLRESSARHALAMIGCGFMGFLAFYIGYYHLDVSLESSYTAGVALAGVLVGAYLNYIRK